MGLGFQGLGRSTDVAEEVHISWGIWPLKDASC